MSEPMLVVGWPVDRETVAAEIRESLPYLGDRETAVAVAEHVTDAILKLMEREVDLECVADPYCVGCLSDCVCDRWKDPPHSGGPFAEHEGCVDIVLAVLRAAGLTVKEVEG